MSEQAFQLVIKSYCKYNNQNSNIMRLRLVCSTFNKLVLNYISRLDICCSYDHNCSESLTKLIRMMPNLTCLNLMLFDNSHGYSFYDDYGDYEDYYIIVTEPNLALFFQSILSDLLRLKLTSLGIRYDSNGKVNTSLLAPSLGELTKLISLTSLSLGTPLADQLVPSLANLTNLTSLKFEFNNIETPKTEYSAPLLEKMIPSFAQTLCKLSNLTDLDLGHNRLEDSEIALLGPSLEILTKLTSINLEAYHITDTGLKLLAPVIIQMPELTSVNFRSNKISFYDSVSFLSSLNKLTKLIDLNLGYNNINEYGFYVLMPILIKLTNLTSFGLDGFYVHVSSDIRSHILEHNFDKLTNLKNLSLEYNNIKVFGPSLAKLTNLTNLNLSNNHLGSDEISLLAPSLIRMTSMTSLDLESNPIRGLAGAQSLISILRGMEHLKFFKIDGYHLGAEGKELLLDVFRKMPELRYEF